MIFFCRGHRFYLYITTNIIFIYKIERKIKETKIQLNITMMKTKNGNYQLFPPNMNTNTNNSTGESITIDTIIYNFNSSALSKDYFKISPEEIENINKKKTINILSQIIDRELKKNPNKMYNLTKRTLFEIDEIQAEIYVSSEINENGCSSYYYKIISKNIYYEDYYDDGDDDDDDDKTKDLVIYDNYGFDTIISLLENIEYVRKNYKILDYYLLSPESMEEAIAQREFIPISQDKICTVCYEPTIEYTTCKHSICLKCRDKCIVQGKKMCPICRNSDLCIYPSL